VSEESARAWVFPASVTVGERRPSSVDADPLTVAAGGRIQARVVTWLCRWAAESLHDESLPLLERLEGARVCWQSCETVIDVLVRR